MQPDPWFGAAFVLLFYALVALVLFVIKRGD